LTGRNSRDQALRERAHRVIPGGMYGHMSTARLPAEYLQFFSAAHGSRIWDADGHEYIDYMCAFGPNLLGYRDAGVDAAARSQMSRGDTMNGPAPLMVDLAERLVGMVDHAEWAMFCKNGTDATAMAMATARSHRRRRKILVAEGAYHGVAQWCVLRGDGVLPEDKAHVLTYRYNDIDSLAAAARAADNDLAGIFATPYRHDTFRDQEPVLPEFAAAARRICDEHDALLILDEVRTGFRLARGGSWESLGIAPDLSCWGKVIANGHPISALLGSDTARDAVTRIFVTGSFWFSAVPMAAALATLDVIEASDYLERIEERGHQLRDGLRQQARHHGFALRQTGPVQMPQMLFEDDPDLVLGHAWTGEALARGVYLHPYHNMFLCAALTEQDVRTTLERTDDAFRALRRRSGDTRAGKQQHANRGLGYDEEQVDHAT